MIKGQVRSFHTKQVAYHLCRKIAVAARSWTRWKSATRRRAIAARRLVRQDATTDDGSSGAIYSRCGRGGTSRPAGIQVFRSTSRVRPFSATWAAPRPHTRTAAGGRSRPRGHGLRRIAGPPSRSPAPCRLVPAGNLSRNARQIRANEQAIFSPEFQGQQRLAGCPVHDFGAGDRSVDKPGPCAVRPEQILIQSPQMAPLRVIAPRPGQPGRLECFRRLRIGGLLAPAKSDRIQLRVTSAAYRLDQTFILKLSRKTETDSFLRTPPP